MKKIILASIFLYGFHVFGSEGTVGNGGDGVRLDNGKVVLYDFYESRLYGQSIDPDVFLAERKSQPQWYNSLAFLGFWRDWDETRLLPETGKRESEITFAVIRVLDRLTQNHPILLRELIDQRDRILWKSYGKDLAPNPDTKPRVDIKEGKRFGCALNRGGTISFAPSCLGDEMSDGHLTGLILHEMLYSLYLQWNPGPAVDSYPVRRILNALFDFEYDVETYRATPSYPITADGLVFPYRFDKSKIEKLEAPKSFKRLLHEAGFEQILRKEEQIKHTFFYSNDHYMMNLSCQFEDFWGFDQIDLNFLGADRIVAAIKGKQGRMSEENPGLHVAGSHQYFGEARGYGSKMYWNLSPKYHLEDAILEISMGGGETLIKMFIDMYDEFGFKPVTIMLRDSGGRKKTARGRCEKI